MNRIWTHIVVDEDNYEIRKFLSLREARHFAERNNLTVVATGEKAVTQRDLYKQALLECGEALFQEYYYVKTIGNIENETCGVD